MPGAEPNVSYYRARYYDPQVGRFFNEDPIHFKAGNHFYKYVNNDPTLFNDPAGLCEASPNHFKDIVCSPFTVGLGLAGLGAGASTLSGAGGSGAGGAILTVLGPEAGAEGIAVITGAAVFPVGVAIIAAGAALALYCF